MNKGNKGNNPQGGKQQISIELPSQEADGTYANLAIISHSNAEFVIDFARLLPGLPKAKVQSRIIMTPQHTKMLLNALEENIAKFESINGDINIGGGGSHLGPFDDFFNNEPNVN